MAQHLCGNVWERDNVWGEAAFLRRGSEWYRSVRQTGNSLQPSVLLYNWGPMRLFSSFTTTRTWFHTVITGQGRTAEIESSNIWFFTSTDACKDFSWTALMYRHHSKCNFSYFFRPAVSSWHSWWKLENFPSINMSSIQNLNHSESQCISIVWSFSIYLTIYSQ